MCTYHKFISIFFALSLLFSSCSKNKDELSLTQILQTDNDGNVVGGDNDQWNISSVENLSEAPYLIRDLNFYLDSIANGLSHIDVETDCVLPDTLVIYGYPNPVSNLEDLRIRIQSSIPFCVYHFSYGGLNELDGGGTATGHFTTNGNTSSECRTSLDFAISDQLLFPSDDMKIGVSVVTEDGCLYSTKGYVMVD